MSLRENYVNDILETFPNDQARFMNDVNQNTFNPTNYVVVRIPPPPPTTRTPFKLEEFLDALFLYERCPLSPSIDAFDSALKAARDRRVTESGQNPLFSHELIRLEDFQAIESTRVQKPPIRSRGLMNTSSLVYGCIQSSKTSEVLFQAYKAGWGKRNRDGKCFQDETCRPMPSIILTFNLKLEITRFKETVTLFNEKVIRIAKMMGANNEELARIPKLKVSTNDDFVYHCETFFHQGLDPANNPGNVPDIPVLIAIGNASALEKVIKILERSSEFITDNYVDGGNNIDVKKDVNVILDEADLFVKDASTVLFQTLNKDCRLWFTGPNPNRTGSQQVGLRREYLKFLDVVSSMQFVTGSPHALSIFLDIFGNRGMDIVISHPNPNYHGLVSGMDCSEIKCKIAYSTQTMFEDMNMYNRRRVAYVTKRLKSEQIKCAKNAAMENTKFLASSFNGDLYGLNVFTTITELGNLFLQESDLFSSVTVTNGLYHAIGKEKTQIEYASGILYCINTQQGLLTFLDKHADSVGLFHVVLYALGMACRATVLKSYEHTWGVTDQLICDGGNLKLDSLMQLLRICGIDLNQSQKILWCSEDVLNRLLKIEKTTSKILTYLKQYVDLNPGANRDGSLQEYINNIKIVSEIETDEEGIINDDLGIVPMISDSDFSRYEDRNLKRKAQELTVCDSSVQERGDIRIYSGQAISHQCPVVINDENVHHDGNDEEDEDVDVVYNDEDKKTIMTDFIKEIIDQHGVIVNGIRMISQPDIRRLLVEDENNEDSVAGKCFPDGNYTVAQFLLTRFRPDNGPITAPGWLEGYNDNIGQFGLKRYKSGTVYFHRR